MSPHEWIAWWLFSGAALGCSSGPSAPAAAVVAATTSAVATPARGDELWARCHAHLPLPEGVWGGVDGYYNRCALAVTGDVSLEGRDCALAAKTAPTPELRFWYESAAADCDCMEQRDWVASGSKLEPWQICR